MIDGERQPPTNHQHRNGGTLEGPEIKFAEAIIDNGKFGQRTVRFETGRLAQQVGEQRGQALHRAHLRVGLRAPRADALRPARPTAPTSLGLPDARAPEPPG